MKVLHFIRKKSQLKTSFILNQVLNNYDCVPSIVFRVNKRNSKSEEFADFNLDSIPYLDLNYGESLYDFFLFNTLKILSGPQIKKIVAFIKDNKIDICHFHYGSDCGVFYPLLKKIRIPSVVSFYGYDSSSFPQYYCGYGKRYLKSRVFNLVSKILVMSPDMKNDLIKSGCPENKIIVHYHGVDCNKFKYHKEYPAKDQLQLLILASLVPKKGHLFLFKSIKKVVDNGVNNFKLRVVGSGTEESILNRYISRQNLNDKIDFVEGVKYGSQEMISEYQNADIFVHPSVTAPDGDKEGIPGTIIEAMSSGVPIISTYHAGIPSIIISGDTGLLVNENDVDALAKAIIKLIQDQKIRNQLGRAGQEYAINNLDIKSKTKDLVDIYKKLILSDN